MEATKGGRHMNDRVFRAKDDHWYYRARGNQDIGPFDSRFEAERSLQKQMRGWTGIGGPLAVWPRSWQPGKFFRRSATRQG